MTKVSYREITNGLNMGTYRIGRRSEINKLSFQQGSRKKNDIHLKNQKAFYSSKCNVGAQKT